ncbi:hypothetical protein RSJ42_08875 [Methanosarcina hadiensis]|uniref:hypothetical protein n=1 Tax=Methanosarcina hadiensis TaxID=3078083 RepID=UPI0039779C53
MSEAKRTSCCCTYSATPRKSMIFYDPDAKLGYFNPKISPLEEAKRPKRTPPSRGGTRARRDSGSAAFTCKVSIECTEATKRQAHIKI